MKLQKPNEIKNKNEIKRYKKIKDRKLWRKSYRNTYTKKN